MKIGYYLGLQKVFYFNIQSKEKENSKHFYFRGKLEAWFRFRSLPEKRVLKLSLNSIRSWFRGWWFTVYEKTKFGFEPVYV